MELSLQLSMPVLLIVASKRNEDIQFCQKIAAQSKFNFTSVSDSQRLNALLIDRPQSLVFWDVDSPEANQTNGALSLAQMLPVLTTRLKTRHVFGLASQSVFELPEVNRVSAIGHYCVRNYSTFAHTWISRLCIPLFSPEPFGLDYYKDETAKIQTIELKAAREKNASIEAVGNLLMRRQMNERAVQMILRVLDEMLMNAIFDAPVDAKGIRYRKETARDGAFLLKDKERIFLNLAFNESFVNISVKDQFGSFISTQAFDAVRKDYSVFSYKSDTATKSAGLGLHGIAASGLSFMISCKPGIATEAVISFPYYKSYKETKDAFRSFSFNVRE
jgi:hypothetical protein